MKALISSDNRLQYRLLKYLLCQIALMYSIQIASQDTFVVKFIVVFFHLHGPVQVTRPNLNLTLLWRRSKSPCPQLG